MTSNNLIKWKRKVVMLHYLEYKIEDLYKKNKINEKERKKLKKIITLLWVDIWRFYPDDYLSLEQPFKLNFG